ncbi:565_t:CDS:1 [Funneliformis mosseae]|uniref:565_t:CDS:1 n=1 Tax=Funneliformis mosseae TaxID=27381 RepID=A0A9N8WA23_FUNMO|nr:565_t:CDS:1 [Funneliformis mosseae]
MTATTQLATLDQFVPELKNIDFQDHHQLQFIDGIPITYILDKLHQLGPNYYNDKSTAYAELQVYGYDKKSFFVHKEYLILQSYFFNEAFRQLTDGDVITISLPYPQDFEPILEYLYDGDDGKFYDTLTVDNYKRIWKNVEYLGLGVEPISICLDFHHHVTKSTITPNL